MCTLRYEWAFVRVVKRPLCHVSRLKLSQWKAIPSTGVKCAVCLYVVCSLWLLCSFLLLHNWDSMKKQLKGRIEAFVSLLFSLWNCTSKKGSLIILELNLLWSFYNPELSGLSGIQLRMNCCQFTGGVKHYWMTITNVSRIDACTVAHFITSTLLSPR